MFNGKTTTTHLVKVDMYFWKISSRALNIKKVNKFQIFSNALFYCFSKRVWFHRKQNNTNNISCRFLFSFRWFEIWVVWILLIWVVVQVSCISSSSVTSIATGTSWLMRRIALVSTISFWNIKKSKLLWIQTIKNFSLNYFLLHKTTEFNQFSKFELKLLAKC